VQQFAMNTIGGVATPVQIVLVVPLLKGLLEVDAMVSTHDTGFVFPGQNTEIKVETFNFTRCGLPVLARRWASSAGLTSSSPLSQSRPASSH
jgi:hypothetical protein